MVSKCRIKHYSQIFWGKNSNKFYRMTPKKCSIEQHLVPAGGPNQETGDSVAARGKNGETDTTVIIRHLVVGLLLESLVHFLLERGNLAGFSTSCVLVDNISLFQQSFSEHISSEHFAVTVILILLEADKLSLAWV